jgi:uncharacterized protein
MDIDFEAMKNIDELTLKAEQGDAKSQFTLAAAYILQFGVAEDRKKTEYWCRKAAKQGYAIAQWYLGNRYEYGIDGIVQKDQKKAMYWYVKAVRSWTIAAEQGDAEAQYELGRCYDCGYGVKEDKEKAVLWWTKAAEQGHFEATLELILCYSHGDGVQKDKEKADYWDKIFTEKIKDCDIT